MFDDMTLYSAEAKMKYDDIAAQARLYRYLYGSYRQGYPAIRRLVAWLRRRLMRTLHRGGEDTSQRNRTQHGDSMGSGYGVRAV